MLLTIFSASNYGGVCRNRGAPTKDLKTYLLSAHLVLTTHYSLLTTHCLPGGVLIFDEKGPAEVKAAPQPLPLTFAPTLTL
eukprot:scaffold89338_cov36-Phaeocystis_antarctica.AAC.1